MSALCLGLDLGTSGLRSAVIDETGRVISTARASYGAAPGAEAWWQGAQACLSAQIKALDEAGIAAQNIRRVGVDGTSGSLVLTDGDLTPVTRPLMYNDAGFEAEAAHIARHAPDTHITKGSGSALARALRLLAEDDGHRARHLLHQADFICAKLRGRGGLSDHNNALKTGFDPGAEAWPAWFDALDLPDGVLPEVQAAGSAAGKIAPDVAQALGLPEDAAIHLGTTDSIAAFLAAAPLEIGTAVTSLGTTLAVKLLSAQRIDAPLIGLYAHRLGDAWLVGGASNTGGGVLLTHFTAEELSSLSQEIDPAQESPLDYYPLSRPGERFPINDPQLAPRMTPRPSSDADFLHGLFESIARIEARCYAALAELGAPSVKQLFSAGGGAQNPTWTQIRARVLGLKISQAEHTEAAIGTARLIQAAG